MPELNKTTPKLPTRLAAERKIAKEDEKLRTRVACAWTLANTTLPGAPEPQRFKLAENLLQNSTPVLKQMLRTAANNSFNTRLAEEFKNVHKVELNEFLDDPSVLTKEKSAIESELKGKPKDASSKVAHGEDCKGCEHCDKEKKASKKVADDTKDAGPQPAEYPDPKRDEPSDLDGDNAAKREPDTIDKSAKSKKKADVDGEPLPEEVVTEEKVEDTPEGEVEKTEEVVEEAPAEEVAVDETPTVDPEPVAEFDEGVAKLEDAIEDVQDSIANLQDDLDEKTKEEDIILPEGEGEGDFTEEDFIEEAPDGEFIDDEFDITQAFDPSNLEEKVSSLANEHDVTAAYGDDGEEFIEEETGEEFFGPSTPGELEGILDQEEALSSPADMFLGETEDPMLALFASNSKRAAEDDVVKPGELEDFFENTEVVADDRDPETDHEDDILFEVLKSEKPVEQGSIRTPQDSEPDLKTAGKKKANLKLSPRDPRKVAASDRQSIAAAIFGNDY